MQAIDFIHLGLVPLPEMKYEVEKNSDVFRNLVELRRLMNLANQPDSKDAHGIMALGKQIIECCLQISEGIVECEATACCTAFPRLRIGELLPILSDEACVFCNNWVSHNNVLGIKWDFCTEVSLEDEEDYDNIDELRNGPEGLLTLSYKRLCESSEEKIAEIRENVPYGEVRVNIYEAITDNKSVLNDRKSSTRLETEFEYYETQLQKTAYQMLGRGIQAIVGLLREFERESIECFNTSKFSAINDLRHQVRYYNEENQEALIWKILRDFDPEASPVHLPLVSSQQWEDYTKKLQAHYLAYDVSPQYRLSIMNMTYDHDCPDGLLDYLLQWCDSMDVFNEILEINCMYRFCLGALQTSKYNESKHPEILNSIPDKEQQQLVNVIREKMLSEGKQIGGQQVNFIYNIFNVKGDHIADGGTKIDNRVYNELITETEQNNNNDENN